MVFNSSSSAASSPAAAWAGWRWFNPLALPLLLLTLTWWVLGAYYEANDDAILTLLLRGTIATGPTGDLRPFVPGLGPVLAALYGALPGIPWYGLTLIGGLYLALALLFGAVDEVTRAAGLPGKWRATLLTLLFGVAFLDQVVTFNFTRPAVLLGAGALLRYAVARGAGQRGYGFLAMGLLAVLLALGIRSDGPLVGMLLAVPGALLVLLPREAWQREARFGWGAWAFAVRRLALTVAPFAVLAVGFLSLAAATRSPAQLEYAKRNLHHGRIHDYHTYYWLPTSNRADSIRVEAAKAWLMGDPALDATFFERAGRTDWGRYVRTEAVGKEAFIVNALVHTYDPQLLLAALLLGLGWLTVAAPAWRARILLLLPLVWVVGVLLVVGAWLKMPDRVAGPAMGILLLSGLLGWARAAEAGGRGLVLPYARWARLGALAVLVLGLLTQAWSIRTRWQIQVALHERSDRLLNALRDRYQQRTLVLSVVLHEALRGTQPLREPDFGTNRILPLTGWNTLDPSYPAYCRALTGGQPTWAAAMSALARDPATVWLLQPWVVDNLRAYLRIIHQQPLPLGPAPAHQCLPAELLTGAGLPPIQCLVPEATATSASPAAKP